MRYPITKYLLPVGFLLGNHCLCFHSYVLALYLKTKVSYRNVLKSKYTHTKIKIEITKGSQWIQWLYFTFLRGEINERLQTKGKKAKKVKALWPI